MVCIISARTRLFYPFLLLSVTRHVAQGHSWIDCLDTDRSKIYDQSASYIFGGASGCGFCAGYGEGYPGRGDPDIGTKYTYKMLKNEVEAGAPVGKAVDPNSYTDWRKRLVVCPGQIAYYSYLPNGHIVKDKKALGTQHGIYWTGQVGTSLTSTHEMTPEHLLGEHTLDFDDGNCGETFDNKGNRSSRAGDGKPCIGSFVVPEGTAPGIYNLVWFWKFWLDDVNAYKDHDMALGYFGAAYSTRIQIEVTSGGSGCPHAVPPAAPPAVIPAGAPASPAAPPATPPAVPAAAPLAGAVVHPAVTVGNAVAGEADPLLLVPHPDTTPPSTSLMVAFSAPMETVQASENMMPSPSADIHGGASSSEMPAPPGRVSLGKRCRRRMRS
ncbi:unnamed protein product [Peronospora belbahrii]|uniref:Chitin-binding type-4 domain-containing protein n=1 Tax=Peronospora belbahrii TaxID=622444 RepID=A0AAU9LTA4_9STRA|nr:unnamed protein product [Peronospora belbahrii]CAH0518051.1 unnamed protein product [Peronospora belbahrii]